jgi:hypothetical protein
MSQEGYVWNLEARRGIEGLNEGPFPFTKECYR